MTATSLVIQLTTSSLSLLGSSTIASMIWFSPNKLRSPYRRIIFCLSLSDILQSLALVTGPFAPPTETAPFALWAAGNVTTCNINGLILVIGTCGIPTYTCFLTFYYVCKLVFGMSDESFVRKFEKTLHRAFIIFNASMGLSAWLTKSFNTSALASFCYYAAHPTGCKNHIKSPNYGECTRGLDSHIFMYIGGIGIPILSLTGVVICMVMLFVHAVKKTRLYNRARDIQGDAHQESEADMLSRIYMRETAIQVCLYVSCFLIVYVVPFSALLYTVSGNVPALVETPSISIVMAIFFPLGGFFNIAIYCRPKVVVLRTRETDISWIKAYMVVVLGGGEIPPNVDSISSSRQHRRQWLSNTQNDEDEEQAQNEGSSYLLQLSNTNNYDTSSDQGHVRSFSRGNQTVSYAASNIGVDGMSLSVKEEDLDRSSSED